MMDGADERAALRPAVHRVCLRRFQRQRRSCKSFVVQRQQSSRYWRRQGTNEVLELLERATDWVTTPQEDPFNFNKVFNSSGLGPQAMSYVNGFLSLVTGAAPANAQELAYGTPEGLQALRRSWESGYRGLSTPPLPQVPASTPVRPVPTAITSDQHELFVMVGVAEGTRTASGGYTKAYYGHRSRRRQHNRGTVSGGAATTCRRQWLIDVGWESLQGFSNVCGRI